MELLPRKGFSMVLLPNKKPPEVVKLYSVSGCAKRILSTFAMTRRLVASGVSGGNWANSRACPVLIRGKISWGMRSLIKRLEPPKTRRVIQIVSNLRSKTILSSLASVSYTHLTLPTIYSV